MRRPKKPSPAFIRDLSENVGRVMIAASQIEHFLTIALAGVLRLTRLQVRALILPMSIGTKMGTLRQLGNEYLSASDSKALGKILDEIKKCAENRNDLAHGFYGVKNGKFALLTFSGSARLTGQPVHWTPTSLTGLRMRMIAARDEAAKIEHMFPKRLKLPKIRPPIVSSDDE